MEHALKIDDLGVPPFQENSIESSNSSGKWQLRIFHTQCPKARGSDPMAMRTKSFESRLKRPPKSTVFQVCCSGLSEKVAAQVA